MTTLLLIGIVAVLLCAALLIVPRFLRSKRKNPYIVTKDDIEERKQETEKELKQIDEVKDEKIDDVHSASNDELIDRANEQLRRRKASDS